MPVKETVVKVKVKDLKEGDMVDMKPSKVPCKYTDPMSMFEFAIVDEMATEESGLIHVAFENMTGVALSPDDELEVHRLENT